MQINIKNQNQCYEKHVHKNDLSSELRNIEKKQNISEHYRADTSSRTDPKPCYLARTDKREVHGAGVPVAGRLGIAELETILSF